MAEIFFNIPEPKKVEGNEKYIVELQQKISNLEKILTAHDIPLPDLIEPTETAEDLPSISAKKLLLNEGTIQEYKSFLDRIQKYHRKLKTCINYNELGIWTMLPKTGMLTVGSVLKLGLCGLGPLSRVDILKGLSGRILPGKLTLLLGPPGSGL